MTVIRSNGSHWLGQQPATVDELLTVLASHPLNRTFEEYGNFRIPLEDGRTIRFWGNFLTVSHVFEIDTDDAATIDCLTSAIRANQARPDYRDQ